MRVFSRQFLGKNHSWADVGRNIARAFIRQGHEVHLYSTDGISRFPEDLKPNLIGYGEKGKGKPTILRKNYSQYDINFSYTAMQNFGAYLNLSMKNKFGIYNYDGTVLPVGWNKFYRHTSKLLPSSEFSKQVFIENKIPENHLEVVPHGINIEDFDIPKEEIYKLKTKKSIKILNVCGQVHRRKNLPGILDTYSKAFKQDDDVCLVLKVADKRPEQKFEIWFKELFAKWKRKNPKHPEVEVIYEYIPRIESLFLACDIHFSMSNIEAFHIPSLQALAANMVVLQSNWGGHTDFLNEKNSLLIDGKIVRCPRNYQYWQSSPLCRMVQPNIDDAVSKLRYAVNNYDKLKMNFSSNIEATVQKYTWDNAASQMISLAE